MPPNERRHLQEAILALIQGERISGPMIRERLNVSQRTFARIIDDLKAAGHRIVAVRDGTVWYYRLEASETPNSKGEKP